MSPRKSCDWTGRGICSSGFREHEAIDQEIEPAAETIEAIALTIEANQAVIDRECQKIEPERERQEAENPDLGGIAGVNEAGKKKLPREGKTKGSEKSLCSRLEK